MNQLEYLAIAGTLLNAWEKSSVQGAIGFAYTSYWSKNWRKIFQPTTKRSNCNLAVTFDSQIKTALSLVSCAG